MLLATLGWIALAGLAAGLGARAFAGYPPAPPGTRRLSRREAAFLAAAADTAFPPGGAIPLSGT